MGYSKKCLLPLTRHSVVLSLLLAWIKAYLFLTGPDYSSRRCMCNMSFAGGASGKKPACQCKRLQRCRFNPWVRNIPWKRARQPTLVFLPEESDDRGAWQATVHSISKNWAQLKLLSIHTRVQYTLNTLAFSWKFLKALALVGY